MARPKCAVEDCNYENNARGLCRTHYGMWMRGNKDLTRTYTPVVPLLESEKEDYWLWVKNHLRLA